MVKTVGVVIMMLGLSGLFGCAQDPGKSDMEVVPTLDTMTYARAAVEVGKIDVAQMPEFKASVERMNVDERTDLWLNLKDLHDRIHPSEAAGHDAEFCDEQISLEEGSGGGCSNQRCSHSSSCGLAQWCCAFGENATFYM